jgi:hypothetical protein
VPTWTWDIGSVVDALQAGEPADRLEWLTEAIHRITTRLLETDMERAWNKAFWLGATPTEDTDV